MRPIRSDQGVYGISVAAQLVGMGVQRLRLYESRGLLEPERTAGGTRRYSQDDLDRLHRIDALLEAGLNLAGIAMVLDLQDENHRLHGRLEKHETPNDQIVRRGQKSDAQTGTAKGGQDDRRAR